MSRGRLQRVRFPPTRLEEKVTVALARIVLKSVHQAEQVLKPLGLTPTQYNALRIINGAGPDGVCGTEIGKRLITTVPDVTRLLDRLEYGGLIVRERDSVNRRFVTAHITVEGQKRLSEAVPLVSELHKGRFKGLNTSQLQTLLELAESVQDGN